MGMVIGKGVIAIRFRDFSSQSKYLIFAGGVHDSSIQDEAQIQDEEKTVRSSLAAHSDATFVYFSTCSILDQNVIHTPYVQHKLRMEKLVQDTAKSFLIFRFPQLIGVSDTKSNLVNFLVDAIANQKLFELWENAEKNLIDIDDIHKIVGEFLKRNSVSNMIVNVASTHQTTVLQLVRDIESFIGLKANYKLVSKGANYEIDTKEIEPILEYLHIDFGENYIANALNKHFGYLISA